MIINASGRTDIVAFYSKWFMNRLKEGYVDVRNPFYKNQVSRIMLNKDNIDAIVFCTKNPLPIFKYLDVLKDYNILFNITITPYQNDIEKYVIPKGLLISKVKELSNKIGKDRIFLRYDPILINEKYTLEYHIKMFDNLLSNIGSYVEKVIISFVDFKKNTLKNNDVLKLKKLSDDDIEILAINFSRIASKYNLTIQTCAEEYDLIKYGFDKKA